MNEVENYINNSDTESKNEINNLIIILQSYIDEACDNHNNINRKETSKIKFSNIKNAIETMIYTDTKATYVLNYLYDKKQDSATNFKIPIKKILDIYNPEEDDDLIKETISELYSIYKYISLNDQETLNSKCIHKNVYSVHFIAEQLFNNEDIDHIISNHKYFYNIIPIKYIYDTKEFQTIIFEKNANINIDYIINYICDSSSKPTKIDNIRKLYNGDLAHTYTKEVDKILRKNLKKNYLFNPDIIEKENELKKNY